MNFPDSIKYTKEHEWIKVLADGTALVGITEFAQDALGDIVFLEIETVGKTVQKDEPFGVIEAVKTASDLFMPISGEVIQLNPLLDQDDGDNPALVNSDPYGDGWIVKIRPANAADIAELLDAQAYKELVKA